MTSPTGSGGPLPSQEGQLPPDPAAPPAGTPAVPSAGAVPAQAPAAQAPAARPPHVVRRTRIGGLWVGLALSAIVLLLLLVFILENQQKASISYFGAHGHLPQGVALLLAAVAGALLVIVPGTGRIIQLRRVARRHRRTDAAARPASVPSDSVPPAAPPAPPADPA
jgi:uncharacterized integral membrane protein